MKIMKSYSQWIPIGVLLGLGIAGVILFFPSAVQIFKIHWLALLAVLVIACGSLGKQPLAAQPEETPRYRLWSWLTQIVILQLSFGTIFLGISVVCTQTAPSLTLPQPAVFQITLTQLLVSEGLFPWAFFVLTAVGAGCYAYCQRQDAYLATTVSAFFPHSFVKVVINFIGRLVSFIAYASTFALIGLLWASLASPAIVTGFALAALLVSGALLLICITKLYRRNIKKMMGKDIPLIPGLFLWVVALAIGIWLLNGFLAPIANISIPPPSLLHYWLHQPWNRLWLIFANSWWMLWTPLMGMTLARISRGYQIRALISATLGLPLIMGITLILTQHSHWDITPLTAAALAGLGLLGILFMTCRKKALPSFILVYLPRQDHYKFRSYHLTFTKLTQTTVGFLFLYLPSGLMMTHFLLFSMALPLILISLSGMIALFRYPKAT